MNRGNEAQEPAAGQAPAMEQQQNAVPAGGDPGKEPAYLGELEKLGELREKGIITEEEFEAKKKQLLGL